MITESFVKKMEDIVGKEHVRRSGADMELYSGTGDWDDELTVTATATIEGATYSGNVAVNYDETSHPQNDSGVTSYGILDFDDIDVDGDGFGFQFEDAMVLSRKFRYEPGSITGPIFPNETVSELAGPDTGNLSGAKMIPQFPEEV